MEVYNVPDQGLADAYLIQSLESNPQSSAQFEQYGSMYNEGAPDYIVDQGLYYPSGTSYGYIYTGYEPTTNWEDQRRFFGLDGQDIHYTVAANESMPYVYYSPNYGYAQSPYNPYNPYIPGAVIGSDGSIISPQQHYTFPSYENPVTPAAYLPVIYQQGPDAVANEIVDAAGSVNKTDGLGSKHNLALNTPNSSLTAFGDTSSRRTFTKMPGGGRANIGIGKQHLSSITSDSIASQSATQVPQIRGPQSIEIGLRGKASVVSGQLKTAFTSGNGSSAIESGNYAQLSVNKVKPVLSGRGPDDGRVGPDTPIDLNRESRMSKSKNQLVVKAYTTRAGNPDAQGNIIISRDQYNRVDFPLEYANAKFFVIKSYSEDDVHKSIKYNVWSSTPNGNKKLNAAYEDAKRIASGDLRGCPIFLFFSVNASGQFCGVAEMNGPVDFHRDMDFWQQDKWSGSFPVKWHIIKDLPNANFRHIILENNENKPVTNSRDTQEISYKKGVDMLKIYKSYTSKTSLLDDFVYYESRQRILQGERARHYMKSYENSYVVPPLDPPRKLQSVHDFPPIGDVSGAKHQQINNMAIANKSEVSSSAASSCSTKDCMEPKGKISLESIPNNLASVSGRCQVLTDKVPNELNKLKISELSIPQFTKFSQILILEHIRNSMGSLELERKIVGWAARDPSGVLSPYTYTLRDTGPQDVYIKVMCCGICHTDVHQIKNDLGMSNYPMVPGHEVVGEVVEVGSDVTKFRAGDVVGVGCIVGCCGNCRPCNSDIEQYCNKKIWSYNDVYTDGKPTQGGFAGAMVADQKFVVKIPDGMAPEQAAPLLCAGVTVYSPLTHFGLNQSGLRGGILGLGGVGHMGVKIAKAMGHHITVISSSDKKRAEALDHLGADDYLVSSDAARMQEAADSLDYIIDTIPVFHPLEPYLSLLKIDGKLILMGVINTPLQFVSPMVMLGRKTITGSFIGSMKELEEMLEFCKDKDLTSTIEVVKMDYVNTAIERLEKNDVRYRFVVDVAGSKLDE